MDDQEQAKEEEEESDEQAENYGDGEKSEDVEKE